MKFISNVVVHNVVRKLDIRLVMSVKIPELKQRRERLCSLAPPFG